MDFAFDVKEANAQALAYVRKESLDIFNRIHSVQEDVGFVGKVHEAYPELPILRMFSLIMYSWYKQIRMPVVQRTCAVVRGMSTLRL